MPLPAAYATGTVTVPVGGTTVTGINTNFIAGGIRPGDVLALKGLTVSVLSVQSATSLTLVAAWPGTAQASQPYEIRYTSDGSRVLAATYEALALLDGGGGGGGDGGTSEQSLAALLASTRTRIVGSYVTTDAEGYAYQVVSSNPDLTTAGGAMLRVLPAAGHLPMEAFNPPATGDAAPVVKRWLERGFALRNVTMTARSRVVLHSLVDAHFPATGSGYPVHRPTIEAGGALFQVAASNTVGGIKITKYNNAQQIIIRDLEIQSLAPIGVHGSPTNGIGLHIYHVPRPGGPGFGTTQQSECLLDNVRVTFSSPPQTGRWDKGIVIDGLWWPTLVACHAVTRHPSNRTTQDFETGAGIECVNCYSPFLYYCQSIGRFLHNILISEDTGMEYEDFQVASCYGVGARWALTIESKDPTLTAATLKEPGGAVIGGHFNGQQHAIRIKHRRQFTVTGTLLYTTLYTTDAVYPDAAGIVIDNCTDALVSVLVPEGGHYNADNDCMSGVVLVGKCKAINIVNCQFGNRGIGVRSLLDPASENVWVHGSVWGSVTDYAPTRKFLDASGAVMGADIVRSQSPGITFGGGSTGVTYGTRDGGWSVNGRMVTFWLDLEVTAKGTSTGAAVITMGAPGPIIGSDFAASINFASGTTVQLAGRIDANGNVALFQVGSDGRMATPLTHAELGNAFTLKMSGTYLAN